MLLVKVAQNGFARCNSFLLLMLVRLHYHSLTLNFFSLMNKVILAFAFFFTLGLSAASAQSC
ncbi:MAG TPA: hypothetical protein PKD78_10030, partial [Saprospiraceae bacterium]|nr:hypothetical protein [Saprospiraceae bacterium]